MNPETLSLDDGWTLALDGESDAGVTRGVRVGDPAPRVPSAIPFAVPGDVHSALLDAGVIEDPYDADNELAVDWVDQQPWRLSRTFTLDAVPDAASGNGASHATLVLEGVDCIAEVSLNGYLVGRCANRFVRHAFDVGDALALGENALEIRFAVARDVAARAAGAFPFELPWLSWNCRVPHVNQIRKTPCHAGWDWNICLMPVGVHGGVRLERRARLRIDDVAVRRRFEGRRVSVALDVGVAVHVPCTVDCRATLAGATVASRVTLYPGETSVALAFELDDPARWWPAGSGPQTRHRLVVEIDGERREHLIGLRETRLRRTPDADGPGAGFAVEINGQALFMRGANWIPSDALPGRETPEALRELLESAVAANMNMIRVWGGGQYESDTFHELCDELGLLVWQDFMFSCNHYPAANPTWLDSVRVEARQQVRRLSRFASLALWCGDNELVGALDWWALTRANRDRYLANYVRLNGALEEAVREQSPDIPWWPSSPSKGPLDYGDGWKDDAAGDMHFWDVWHEAKPFTAYREVRPRFCSEFGFQSFPSMPVIGTFARPADRDVSSAVMDVHQRNAGGNARIVETLVRHFRFPESFERIVYLSQIQQAMAITTAVESWRTLAPHCMGALYWQLNDTWPVASWASLEYGGGWKLLHHAARRFFAPVLVAIVPEAPAGDAAGADGHAPAKALSAEGEGRVPEHLVVRAVGEARGRVELDVTLRAIDVLDGRVRERWHDRVALDSEAGIDVRRLALADVPPGCFLQVRWRAADAADGPSGEGEYWPSPYKRFAIGAPAIDCRVVAGAREGADTVVELTSDRPAFFVSVELGGRRVWSDGGFTLLPGETKRLHVTRVLGHPAVPDVEPLGIAHL